MNDARDKLIRHREDVLGTLEDGHPVWVCIKDVLTESKEQSIDTVTREDITAEQRAYCAGYLACAVDAYKELDRLRTSHLARDPKAS
jgi:hypothetical protein